jgi:exocyst complex component 8
MCLNSLTAGRQLLLTMDTKQQTYPLLSLHLSGHTRQLTNRLSHGLSMESQSPKSTKRYSHLLIRLGEDELARSIYLQSRTAYLRKKIRAMQAIRAYSTNEVDAFVEGIAWLTIRVIKNSWSIYSEVFSETKMASSFMEWVKEQVEGMFPPIIFSNCVVFADIFRRQLFGYSVESELYIRCREGVRGVWDELKGLGLDMMFLLEALIVDQALGEKEYAPLSESISGIEEGVGLGIENS